MRVTKENFESERKKFKQLWEEERDAAEWGVWLQELSDIILWEYAVGLPEELSYFEVDIEKIDYQLNLAGYAMYYPTKAFNEALDKFNNREDAWFRIVAGKTNTELIFFLHG